MFRYLIFLYLPLIGANLVNVDFIKNKYRVDIFLTLDEKFNGKIVRLNSSDILITNINSLNVFNKSFNNYFIRKINISPFKKGILVKVYNSLPYNVSAALSIDKYVIRFRFKIKSNKINNNIFYLSSLIKVVIIYLVIIFVIIYVFKKRQKMDSNVKVVFKKLIDSKNYLSLIKFESKYYLVIIGSNNILLDIFDEEYTKGFNRKELYEFMKRRNIEKDLEIFKKYIAD